MIINLYIYHINIKHFFYNIRILWVIIRSTDETEKKSINRSWTLEDYHENIVRKKEEILTYHRLVAVKS